MENLPLQLMVAIRHPLYIKHSRKFYASYSNSVEKSCPNGTKIWSVRNCWISPTRNRKKIIMLCAYKYTFHHQAFQCCTIQFCSCNTIFQGSRNTWTQKKIKLQWKCYFRGFICVVRGVLMKIKGTNFLCTLILCSKSMWTKHPVTIIK